MGAADRGAAREPDRALRSGGARVGCPCACLERPGKRRGPVRSASLGRARRIRRAGRRVWTWVPPLGTFARDRLRRRCAPGARRGRRPERPRGRREGGWAPRRRVRPRAQPARPGESRRRGHPASPAANARNLAAAVTRRPSAAVALTLVALAACGGRDPLARRATRLETLVDPARMKRNVESLARGAPGPPPRAALAPGGGRDPLARRATRLETLVDPARMKRNVEILARRASGS